MSAPMTLPPLHNQLTTLSFPNCSPNRTLEQVPKKKNQNVPRNGSLKKVCLNRRFLKLFTRNDSPFIPRKGNLKTILNQKVQTEGQSDTQTVH